MPNQLGSGQSGGLASWDGLWAWPAGIRPVCGPGQLGSGQPVGLASWVSCGLCAWPAWIRPPAVPGGVPGSRGAADWTSHVGETKKATCLSPRGSCLQKAMNVIGIGRPTAKKVHTSEPKSQTQKKHKPNKNHKPQKIKSSGKTPLP